MEIWLLRHPALTETGKCLGQSEGILHPEWLTRLPATKPLLPNPLPRVYTSPSPRCLVVAGFLGRAKVTADERLYELNFGSWEGKPWKDLPPGDIEDWMVDMEETAPHGGETGNDLLDRAINFFEELLERDEDALVIADAGWIRAMLALLLGTNLEHAFRLDIDHLSLTHVVCKEDLVTLSYINRNAPPKTQP